MTRSTIVLLLSLAAALVACKSKPKPDNQPGSATTTTPGSGSAPAATVKLPAGTAQFGCIGWNAATKSAACITGEDSMGEEPRYQIEYVNSDEPATKLVVKQGADIRAFEDATAANATLAKLGMEPFPSPAKKITGPVPGDSDLGGGAKLVWSDKIMDEGGDNRAPTTAHELSVTCANKQEVELEKVEQEGLDLEVYVWSVPGHVVIEQATHIGREGESRSLRKVGLLELATCKYVDGGG